MNRTELCTNIHEQLADMIIERRGVIIGVEIPIVTEMKNDAVAVANYLRGMGYIVTLREEMKNFLYLLKVTWI